MKDMVEKVVEALKKSIKVFEDDSISRNRFHNLNKIKSGKKLIFVDGGNTEILAMPHLSLQLIRVFYSVYQENKKIKAEKTEFYLLVKAVDENENIIYKTELFPIKGEINLKLSFDSLDPKIITGSQRASISKIGEIVRRFAELYIASNTIEKNNNSVVVLDGSLECLYSGEINIMEKLYETAKKNKSVVTALSKTSRLLTKKGNSIANILNNIGPEGIWYYKDNIENTDNVEIFFVRLNKNSNHVFRLDIQKDIKKDLDEIFSLLADNSKDLSFPGYPYGLIEADKFARVSNNEKEVLRTLFLSKIGVSSREIRKFLSSLDAHKILDKLVSTSQ